jgi:hypothetical protein
MLIRCLLGFGREGRSERLLFLYASLRGAFRLGNQIGTGVQKRGDESIAVGVFQEFLFRVWIHRYEMAGVSFPWSWGSNEITMTSMIPNVIVLAGMIFFVCEKFT